jgi:hypothetical protein
MVYGEIDQETDAFVAFDFKPFTCDNPLFCPACAARQSRSEARLLRHYLASRVDKAEGVLAQDGDLELAQERAARLFFRMDVTQQDYKWSRARGKADAVVDRLFASYKRMTVPSRAKREPDAAAKPELNARWWFTQLVEGMTYGFEVTYNDERGSYHPHLHLAGELRVPPAWFVEQEGHEDAAAAVED